MVNYWLCLLKIWSMNLNKPVLADKIKQQKTKESKPKQIRVVKGNLLKEWIATQPTTTNKQIITTPGN